MAMHIHEWPKGERPRERLLALGAGKLSDAELLAIFLGSGLPGSDAIATGRNLLERAGSLAALLHMEPSRMQRLRGLGLARSCKLAASLELGRRVLYAELERGVAMTDPPVAGRYFSQRLRTYGHEVFAVMYLDTRHRALGFEEVFQGTVDSTEVHAREVVRRALKHNASAVIIGHNHPSGCPEPSSADRTVTRKLKEALDLVDVRLLDHFVVGDGPPVSLAARGWV